MKTRVFLIHRGRRGVGGFFQAVRISQFDDIYLRFLYLQYFVGNITYFAYSCPWQDNKIGAAQG